MNSRQFVAKQRVKYLWKTLKYSNHATKQNYRDVEGAGELSFWDYEQTPRTLV